MAKIQCQIDQIELDGDYGSVMSVQATCSKCGHSTKSYGTGQSSINRCLALLNEGCPSGENNLYEEN